MEEIWKDIEGFEGLYQVSNLGRIRSLDREVAGCYGSVHIMKGKVLKGAIINGGYLQVILNKEGKYKHFLVHRLVWMAFNGTIPKDYEVNHLDECKTNNRLDNLNLLTHKQNVNFGTRTERAAKAQSKPVVAFDEAGNVVFEFPSAMEAKRNGFNNVAVSKCCLDKRRTHRGLKWEYKN